MCGIVGYVGKAQAAPVILDGLSKLEYRGYDSAGMAIFDGEHIQIEKSVGRLKVLEELTHGGETFLAERESVRSICGCYVKPEFRHAGIAKALLDEVVKYVKAQGYRYLGTDYETINPTALRFWTIFFSPYTYSYIRRLDERLIG